MSSEFNEFSQLEGFERVSMLISIIDDRLGYVGLDSLGNIDYYDPLELHPSIHNDEAKILLAKAIEALTDLYQKIGEWGFHEEQIKGTVGKELI